MQAAIIPVVTAIGGGSAMAGTVLLATAATSLYAGVASAKTERVAGRNAEAQANIDANAEGDAARQREIERKKGLARAFSSQLAQAGATGIAFSEGSPAKIAQLDIAEAVSDTRIDNASSKQRQSSLRSQGRAARFIGDNRSTVALIDAAAGFGGTVGGAIGAIPKKKAATPAKKRAVVIGPP